MLIAANHNLYYDVGTGPTASIFDSTDAHTWTTWVATGFDVNGKYADPLLTASFDLPSDSPAKDAGDDLSSVGFITDKNGRSRPSGAAWDIGAYEYQVFKNHGSPKSMMSRPPS